MRKDQRTEQERREAAERVTRQIERYRAEQRAALAPISQQGSLSL